MSEKTLQSYLKNSFIENNDKISIEFGKRKITYKELDEISNNIAMNLIKLKVKPESHIGILLEDKILFISTIIAIIKIRCIFVPLDNYYMDDRLEDMLNISDTQYIITDNNNYQRLDNIKKYNHFVKTYIVDDLQIINSDLDISNYNFQYSPQDKLCIYFTSGSTGRPNAVLGKNTSVLHFAEWEINKFKFGNKDKISQFTINSNDAFLRDLFVALLSGGVLCVPPDKATILDHDKLISWIDKSKLSVIHCTPSLFRVIGGNSLNTNLFQTLKKIFMVGERIPMNIINSWFEIFGERIEIINLYGATETSLAKMFYRIKREDLRRTNIPIGRPIKGAKAIILDENMQICTQNTIGEIYIRTPYLTHGYYNNPNLNKEKFVKNPFVDSDNEIIYKTGDYGRYIQGGIIEFIGRKDRQIKVRGNRIELDDIECAIMKIDGIKTCAVKWFNSENNEDGYIVAYIVADKLIDINEFNLKLDTKLDKNMIPRFVSQLKSMPLTNSGKIDYKNLKIPKMNNNVATITEPRNNIERKLAEIWKEILDIKVIDVKQDFFKVGGHSLKVMTLISKIYKAFNIEIPLDVIFNNTSIEKMSKYIKENVENEYLMEKIKPITISEFYEASSAQKRIYILNQLDKKGINYNQPSIWEINTEIDLNKFKDSITKLIDRHESLRTSFHVINGDLKQRINNASEINFNIEYIECNECEVENKFEQFIKPFDLDRAPLFRISLLRIDELRHLLFFDIHHIISDGSSINILLNDFKKIYFSEELEVIKIQYKDYTHWHNKFINSDEVKEQEKFWVDLFKDDIPVLDIPTDYKRPLIQNFDGTNISFKFDAELTEGIRKLGANNEATLYMTLLSIWNILLSKLSGQEDVVIGSPIAGRNRSELQLITGIFVNTIVMRNKPKGNLKFKEFLQSVKQNAINAYSNQDYQFNDLVDKLSIKRDLSRNPLFDNMFVLHNTDKQEIQNENSLFKKYSNINNKCISKFDLNLSAIEVEKEIEFNLEYCRCLYKKNTIKRMISSFLNIAKQVIKDEEIIINKVDILSDLDKELLLQFNLSSTRKIEYKSIVERFDEQVEKTPDRVAIAFKDKVLTYKQLQVRSNEIANYLKSRKSGKEQLIVGVFMEKSINIIASVLGILKSESIYIPIDTKIPYERIRNIIDDAQVSYILSSKNQINTLNQLQNDCKGINKYICLDMENEIEKCVNMNYVQDSIDKEQIAYVLYTSGSTGKPKGVMIQHKALSSFVDSVVDVVEFTDEKTIAATTAISFDIFIFETLLPLTKGMKIVMSDENVQLDNKKLLDLISNEEIDILQMTPSRMQVLINSQEELECLKRLKCIMLGGEVFTDNLLEQLKRLTNARIFNGYGPTEDTVYSTIKELTNSTSVNIGKPVSKSRIYIVDKNLNLVPIGVRGELCISGNGVAKGYLNDNGLTMEKFIKNPFSKNEIMYRTGDIARWLDTGEIEYVGRDDDQVKIRGIRIEIGEIQNVLVNIDDIKDAIVIYKENTFEKHLCAYYTTDKKLEIGEIRGRLLKKLPEYMIPTYFVQLDKIPLNTNGKADKNYLPDPLVSINRNGIDDGVRNEVEERLTKIWSEILYLDNIRINESFFDLGGDSFKIIQMQMMIEKEFGKKIETTDLFIRYTIRELAIFINELDNCNSEVSIKNTLFPESYYENNVIDQEFMNFKYKVSEEVYIKLKKDAEENGVLLKDMFLSMYGFLLSQICKKDKVNIYTPLENDDMLEIEINVKDKGSLSELSKYVNEELNSKNIVKNNYNNMVKELKTRNYLEVSHLFIYGNQNVKNNNIFDITLLCEEQKSSLEISLMCTNDKLSRKKIKDFFKYYINIIIQSVDNI
ncbi:amino acid adenylation domain-containing protein [Clostridium botulinum]|nr:amino acid adenylation domain-containing protein [Clostridium botulinum]